MFHVRMSWNMKENWKDALEKVGGKVTIFSLLSFFARVHQFSVSPTNFEQMCVLLCHLVILKS